MKEWLKNNRIKLIFLVFFLVILLEHQFLWLYHDDYGYASLSYAFVVNDVVGHSFTLSQLLEFCIGHYQVWGGRVLYFLIECQALEVGLWFFRILQSVVITGIFYAIYKVISTIIKCKDWHVALMTVTCYGLFEIMMVRSGIFWVTASVLYVFPILPFLGFVYFYTIKKEPKNNKKVFYMANALLIFLACFSQEQVAAMALSYIGLITLYEFLQTKKINWKNCAMLISGLIGFGILMLAPGNEIRMQHPTSAGFYELGLLEKLKQNIPQVLLNNFGAFTRLFTVFFFITICYFCYRCMKQKYGNKILNAISNISNGIILVFTLCKEVGYFQYVASLFENDIGKNLIMIIFILQLLLIVYTITIYFYRKKLIMMICLFYSAIISQAVMLVAPYFPLRSALIFEFIIFVFMIYAFADLYNIMRKKNSIIYLMIPVLIISSTNLFLITKGYAENNKMNKKNDLILRKASTKIKKGESISTISLFKMKDDAYSGEQPYMPGADYITTWIKEYYDLPSDIKIIYSK